MGIRVFESEDMFSDEDCSTCCSCHNTATATTTTNTSDNNVSSSTSSHSKCNGNDLPSSDQANFYESNHGQATTCCKEIVSNCKAMSIDVNTSNLRIVGNNNRIRITLNTGDLTVIGNNTRLKIQTNHGLIKYTGNDGRIRLGSDSQQQLVDYIGCNGTLKIVNSMKFSKGKCDAASADSSNYKNKTPASDRKCCGTTKKTCCHKLNTNNNNNSDKQFVGNSDMKSPLEASVNNKYNITTTTTTTRKIDTSANRNIKPKEKSHSYGGSSSAEEQSQWQTFSKLFNDAKKSMPNLTSAPTQYETGYCNRTSATPSIVQNIGNIVIANAANICISPYVRNITTQA